jgi:CheY-like chemotaxis protein
VCSKPRALLVEDHRLNMELMRAILLRAGFDVDGARTGAEAIRKAGGFVPDVVLLDILLPDMNGLDIACELRSKPATANTTIVAVSAEVGDDIRQQAFAAGCDGYVLKPIDTRTFAKSISGFMAGEAGWRPFPGAGEPGEPPMSVL